MNKKIVISMGHGRLHAIELSEALLNNGVSPTVIGGWVPRKMPRVLVNMLGALASRNNLYERLMSRARIHECGGDYKGLFLPEAATQIMMIFARIGFLNYSNAVAFGWQYFGRSTKSYLTGGVFHVRSGAGQGGAIARAKLNNMLVVADHSIAHPAAMESNMAALYEKCDVDFNAGPNDVFWKMVIQDCKDADLVVVNSDYVKETFVEQGFSPAKIIVNYWGVREDFFGLKTDYALNSDGVLRFLFTGSFGLRKGALEMIEAAKHLTELGHRCKFIIAGSDDEGLALLEQRAPELKHCFEFRGFIAQESLKALFVESDIFVFPSYSEGCARSAMEALASGLPVVCTRETGLPQNPDGLYFPVEKGNSKRLSEAIIELCANEALRAEIGQAGLNYIRTHGSWDAYGKRLLEMYERAGYEAAAIDVDMCRYTKCNK